MAESVLAKHYIPLAGPPFLGNATKETGDVGPPTARAHSIGHIRRITFYLLPTALVTGAGYLRSFPRWSLSWGEGDRRLMMFEMHGHRERHLVVMLRLRDVMVDLVRRIGIVLWNMLGGCVVWARRGMRENGAEGRVSGGPYRYIAACPTCSGYK